MYDDTAARQGRKKLLGIFLAFFGPLALAVFLFANLDLWQPKTTANHGALMQPVRPLAMLNLRSADGTRLALEDLYGKWTLAYVAEGPCNLHCETDLFKMRQARAALGRDLVRVQYLYVALDQAAWESARAMQADHPRMMAGYVTTADKQPQAAAFDTEPVGNVYLLDPHGNLVLRYDDQATTKGIIKDLKRLLKVSKIG